MIGKLTKTLAVIRNNKLLFLILVIIQILAVVAFSIITAKFQLLLLEDLNNTLEPLQNANYDPQKVDAGQPFLEEMIPLLQGYASMKSHFIDYMLWITFFFLVVNGVLWLGSHSMISRYSAKQVLKQWFNYLIAAIIGMAILWIAGLLLSQSLFSSSSFALSLESALTGMGIIGFIVYYLWIIAFANVNENSVKSFWTVFWNILCLIYKTIPYFLLNAVLLGLFGYAIYITSIVQENFNIMIVLVVLAMLVLVVARLFWIIALNKSHREFSERSSIS